MLSSNLYRSYLKSALIGSHKGSCHIYDTSGTSLHLYHDHHVSIFFSLALTLPFLLPFWTDNRLLQKKQIDLQNKKKKSNQKKITGFQVLSRNKFVYTLHTIFFIIKPVLLNNSSLNSFSQETLQRSLLRLQIQESGLLMTLI